MLNCNDTFDIKNKLRSYKGWPSVFVFFPVMIKILPASPCKHLTRHAALAFGRALRDPKG